MWGGAFSKETDYTTFTASAGIARDFNDKNTTLSLNGSFEEDISYPHIRTPAPFQRLDSLVTGANGHKSVITGMVGLTQTLTRSWLTQLNLGFSTDNGYQSDPYRVISAVDGTTGAPFLYLFESRPRSRQRYNVYWGNKVALGPTVLDVSARYYHDTWGINSITAEVSEQVPITRWLYVKPTFRYYHQGAANFYKPWLTGVGTQTTVTHTPGGEEGGGTTTTSTIVTGLPAYASSDSRLSRFNAVTLGGRIGWRLFANSEFYIDGEIYRQSGAHTVPGAPGGLAGLDVFSGVKAVSVMSGVWRGVTGLLPRHPRHWPRPWFIRSPLMRWAAPARCRWTVRTPPMPNGLAPSRATRRCASSASTAVIARTASWGRSMAAPAARRCSMPRPRS